MANGFSQHSMIASRARWIWRSTLVLFSRKVGHGVLGRITTELFTTTLKKISVFIVTHESEVEKNRNEHRNKSQENGTDPTDHKDYDRGKNGP